MRRPTATKPRINSSDGRRMSGIDIPLAHVRLRLAHWSIRAGPAQFHMQGESLIQTRALA